MSFFDRLAGGPGNLQQGDYQDWNQMVGSAPQEQFGRAAYGAIQRVDPQEYYQHTQPGIGGTAPFRSPAPPQRGGLAPSLPRSLFNPAVAPQHGMPGAGL